MKRVKLDKIASAAKTAGIETDACLSDRIVSREGFVIAARVLNDKAVYNQMENPEGRMTRLKSGDRIAAVLGHRRALHGYAGDVPTDLNVGDRLEMLNLGGVVGRCTSYNPDVGRPFELEVLGSVLHFPYLGERVGEPAHIGLHAISANGVPAGCPPIVAVVGTCMDAGKTVAACEVIHGLARGNLRVAAAKVTGVALQRDTLNMVDHGAIEALSFLDAGVVSTDAQTAPGAARRLVNHLCRLRPDVIVMEFGDGVFGEYGVQEVLQDPTIRPAIRTVLLCANDPAGAWGAVSYLQAQLKLRVSVVSGRVTDNEVGSCFVRQTLKLPGANALTDPDSLTECVRREVLSGGGVQSFPARISRAGTLLAP